MRKIYLILVLVICYKGNYRSQNGFYINGADASFFVGQGATLFVGGNFGVKKCKPVDVVRFQGTLFVTDSLICNDVLKFFPITAAGSKQCRVVFHSNQLAAIAGTYTPEFWELEINKGQGSSLFLKNSILCKDTITFSSGFIIPGNQKIILQDPVGTVQVDNHPWIKNERQGSQFYCINPLDTGKIIYNTIYTGTLNFPSANIGFSLTGPVNIGSTVSVIRGVRAQNNCAKTTLYQYFEIVSPSHILTSNTLTLRYTLNNAVGIQIQNLSLSNLKPYFSNRTDINWTPTNFALPQGALGTFSPNLDVSMVIPLSELRHKNMLADSSAFRVAIASPDCSSPPVSALLADTLHLCAGDSVVLDAGNNGSVIGYNLRYAWTTPLPAYTRTLVAKPTAQFQTYRVRLLDARGCTSYDSVIIAPSAPFPQIHYLNYLNACVGDSITIKDSVTLASGTFSNVITFSNGSSAITTAKKFKKLISAIGNYSMQLISTSNYGCTSSTTASGITVYGLPTISYSTTYNCAIRQMSFTSTSISNYTALPIATNKWKFSATDSINGNSISKSYSIAGTYTAQLNSTSSFGCKNTSTQSFTVYPFNAAVFTKNNACLGDTCYLKNTSTCLTGSCNISWNLGDNTSSTLDSLKKIYTSAGLKNVSLKITAPVGCADSITRPIFVSPLPAALISSSTNSICVGDSYLATNASTISGGAITSNTWLVNGQQYAATWNTAITGSIAGTQSLSLILQSDSGCTASITKIFTVNTLPNSSFFVANVCLGKQSTFTVLSTQVGTSYTLLPQQFVNPISNSSGVINYTYNLAGAYTPTLQALSIAGCSTSSVFNHTVNAVPTSPFSGTISTCGTQYVLNAQNTGGSYLWFPTNQITQTINCTQSNLYKVAITAANNCTSQSQVYVKLNAEVAPNLGNDTTVCGKKILDAGYAGASFSWNTGQNTQTISAQQTGLYKVTVIDQNNCLGKDSISLVVLPNPTVTASADIVQCRPSNMFTLSVSGSAQSYSWSSGQTGSTISTSITGNYLVVGTSTNGCKMQDTVTVLILATPSISLGGNSISCDKKIIDLIPNGASVLWQNGSTANSYTVNSSEKIWVMLTNTATACTDADTMDVIIAGYPQFSLGNDTISCSAQALTIGAEIPNCNYLWNAGQTTPTILPQSTGLYALTITSNYGCATTDYIQITKVTSPELNLGSSIRYLCTTSSLTLATSETGQYIWKKNNLTFATTSSITVDEAAKYNLTVSKNGCTSQDSVLVVASNQTVQADFLAATYDTINRAIKFVNLSKPSITAANWDFGDGTSSNVLHPEHTWYSPTDYSVTLTVSNNFCEDHVTKKLSLLFREAVFKEQQAKVLEIRKAILFPNPTRSTFSLQLDFSKEASLQVVITNALGEVITSDKHLAVSTFQKEYTLEQAAAGLYFVKIAASENGNKVTTVLKLILEK